MEPEPGVRLSRPESTSSGPASGLPPRVGVPSTRVGVTSTRAGGWHRSASQQLESGGRQRNLAVLATLAADAKNATGTVDVGDLKADALHETQAAGVNRRQADAVDVDAHGVDDAPDLVAAEHYGELLFGARLGDIQALPLAAERLVVEETEAAEDDRKGAAGDLLVQLQVQQVAADLVFFERVGRPLIVAC